ncbi:hypothetical protein ACFFWD_07895 [Bradyrhizobium erythrophlei]|uniref:hypothetical protein n=1 Tax=Bradyrhizobium erythrophlei TaxID=1437360 RepID=UPI0035E578E6
MKMESTAWPDVRSDLASTRRGAAIFLDNLADGVICGATGRQTWAAKWTEIGDAQCLLADRNINKKAFDEAAEAWLCALTSFEVARRLINKDDPNSGDISAKVDADIHRFGLSLRQKVERVQIAWCDQAEFPAYYVPAGHPDLCAPAVICISCEQETGATLLGRLLPAVIGRGMSVLVISHDDVSNRSGVEPEMLLSCCLDYLSSRPEVDAGRIGVYGDGLSAALATAFAASDRRVAAAVCDGGLWSLARDLAAVSWMTRAADAVDEDIVSTHRSGEKRDCPSAAYCVRRSAAHRTKYIG